MQRSKVMCNIINQLRTEYTKRKIEDRINQLWDLHDTTDDEEVKSKVRDEIGILERKLTKIT